MSQAHDCPHCGYRYARGGKCTRAGCDGPVLIPLWNVINMKGRVIGWVAGFGEYGALESAGQTPAFDREPGLAVRPKQTYAPTLLPAAKAILASLPELWGDSVVDGRVTVTLDGNDIDALRDAVTGAEN